MNSISSSSPAHGHSDATVHDSQSHKLQLVHDESCTLGMFTYLRHPTGADILAAVGRPADKDQVVMQLLLSGGLEDIRLDERVNLALGDKFVLGSGDCLFRFTLNGKQCAWPHRHISGSLVLALAGLDHEHSVKLVREGVECFVAPSELVDLSQSGVEELLTVKHTWILIVGGVPLQYTTPLVRVAEAMTRAHFDIAKAWHIYLIVHSQEKKELQLDSIVDLRTPGVEKIRLTPRNVANGDGQSPALRREFKVLPLDAQYLDSQGFHWEAVCDGERRWLLIHDFALPAGYTPTTSLLALDIPKDYPAAQIDMFYFAPAIRLNNGQVIPNIQVTAAIHGVTFQGWSRHRNPPHEWDPNSDCVRTHMALVESCLAKELGQ